MPPRTDEPIESRTLAVLVENEPGVLARVVGLFSARGYNIESLTVAETDRSAHTSRITIVTSGQPIIIEQIKAQLERIVSVREVIDVTLDPAGVQRELVLLKVRVPVHQRAEALQLGEVFRAKVIDITMQTVIFELTGNKVKVEAFIELMGPLGLVEVSRTGALSIQRGVDGE